MLPAESRQHAGVGARGVPAVGRLPGRVQLRRLTTPHAAHQLSIREVALQQLVRELDTWRLLRGWHPAAAEGEASGTSVDGTPAAATPSMISACWAIVRETLAVSVSKKVKSRKESLIVVGFFRGTPELRGA